MKASSRTIVHALTGAIVLAGLVGAWRLRWVCDDAFISFRYALNLADGHGLVWNLSERVEGYTNLLWTLLISAGMAVGLEPIRLSWGLGLLAWVISVALLYRLELFDGHSEIPMATWVFALCPDVQTWATGGLETMPLTAALAATALASRCQRPWTVALLGCVDWLLHPDAILPAAVLLLAASGGIRRGLAPGALLMFGVAATTAWRWLYYGALLPNTFYAKSAGTPWLSQGERYVALFFWRNWALTVLLLTGLCMLGASAARARRIPPHAWTALAGLSFVLYVIYSGGDFMQARRLVPVLPLLLAPAAQTALAEVSQTVALPMALALAIAAAIPWPVFGDQSRFWGVADERAFYPREVIEMRREQGRELARVLDGSREPLLIEGGLCMLAFYSGRDAIIEINGLTDATLARQPLAVRSIAGHEKGPTGEYLDRRGVHLVVLHAPVASPPPVDVAVLPATGLALRIRHPVPDLMRLLASRGVGLVRSDAALE